MNRLMTPRAVLFVALPSLIKISTWSKYCPPDYTLTEILGGLLASHSVSFLFPPFICPPQMKFEVFAHLTSIFTKLLINIDFYNKNYNLN